MDNAAFGRRSGVGRIWAWGASGLGRLIRAAGLVCAVWPVLAQAARPSYDAARQFGFELQKGYAERRMNAVIDKLDEDAMRRQVLPVFGILDLDSSSAKFQWKTSFQDGVRNRLKAFEGLDTLVMSRVLWLEGRRTLECLLLDTQGQFQVLTLWLNQKTDGTILIDDYQMLGSSLGMVRRMRHGALLTGAPISDGLTEEEKDLAFQAEEFVRQIRMAFDHLTQGRLTAAFKIWASLPPEIQRQRIWQDIRDGLATMGCEPAQAQMMDEFRRGQLANRFLRFVYARKAGDAVASLKALEALIEENYEMPFLRVQKAELLVAAGSAEPALALAREIYELNPYSTGAYFAAIHAAAALRQPGAAVQALQRWNLLMPAGEIDKLLRTEKSVEGFIGTADYARWLEQAAAVTAASSPEP